MASKKRAPDNQNTDPFHNFSGPNTKKSRLKAQKNVSLADIQNLQQEQAAQEAEQQRTRELEAAKWRVEIVLGTITQVGYGSLYMFVDEILTLPDQQILLRVSNMLGHHSEAILERIRQRQPNLILSWALNLTGESLAQEGQKLADHFRPAEGQSVSSSLDEFSLEQHMADAEAIVPSLCMILRKVSQSAASTSKDQV